MTVSTIDTRIHLGITVRTEQPLSENAAVTNIVSLLLDIFNVPAETAPLPEVTWPGGICPTLPADPESEGWTLAMAENDDASSDLTTIGFTFNLFGRSYTKMYVNNNGNISFKDPYGEYTAEG